LCQITQNKGIIFFTTKIEIEAMMRLIILFLFISCTTKFANKKPSTNNELREKTLEIKKNIKTVDGIFDLVGCKKVGELKEDNKDNDMLEVNVYMKIKKLKGNTLNGVKKFQKYENPGSETIFGLGDKVNYFYADVYSC
tara:strand:- start:524 stop:940 length:417 start_codon:yes stop_codon:yes gene_type:complete